MDKEGKEDKIRRYANRSIEDGFGRENDYDHAKVLAIHWQDTGPENYEEEAIKLTEFFATRLGFETEIFRIPSLNSSASLKMTIKNFLLRQGGERSLYVIHYGGHGDRDYEDHENRRRRSVWAARAERGGPKLNWSDIQPCLGNAAGDVLLLLDCCCAIQAAREQPKDRIIPGNVEMLAASAMGNEKTPPPGEHSFTSKLIKELEAHLHSNKYARISELHKSLLQEDRKFIETPIHTSLAARRGSIRLAQLQSLPDTKRKPTDIGSLTLELPLLMDPTEKILDEIAEWLRDRPPHAISSEASFTNVVLRAQPLCDYIGRSTKGDSPITAIDNLPGPSHQNIQSKWSLLGALLQYVSRSRILNSAANLFPSYSEAEADRNLAALIKNLEDAVAAIENVIDQSIQELPELRKEEQLRQAIRETTITRLQSTVESLKIRCAAQFPPKNSDISIVDFHTLAMNQEPEPFQALNIVEAGPYENWLVEYRYYDKENMTKHQFQLNEQRMRALVNVLQMPATGSFGTLPCIGWKSEPERARHCLLFGLPEGYKGPPLSLRDAILGSKRGKPTLGQRFAIAKTIAQALLKWHTSGWVHQSIASYNIMFLCQEGSASVDFTKPFLCGFEYTRVVGFQSTERHPDHRKSEYDLYRHPDRQGESMQTHKKEHDIYSFGLLLLEIGLWDKLEVAFPVPSPKKLRTEILSHLSKRNQRGGLVRFEMGTAYEQGLHKCISGSLCVDQDDDNEDRLAQNFRVEVLQRIAQGSSIDAP